MGRILADFCIHPRKSAKSAVYHGQSVHASYAHLKLVHALAEDQVAAHKVIPEGALHVPAPFRKTGERRESVPLLRTMIVLAVMF